MYNLRPAWCWDSPISLDFPCRLSFHQCATGIFNHYHRHYIFYREFAPSSRPLILCGPELISRYCDSLRVERSGDRIPVRARFSAPIQTGPGAHPASYTVGTGSLSGGSKETGAWCWPPTPPRVDFKERVELDLCSPSGPSWPVPGRTSPILLLSCSERKYTQHHTRLW